MGQTAIPPTMSAVVMAQQGGLEHVALASVPVPAPAADEVLIRVATVAVNRQDINLFTGHIPSPKLPLPHVLGLDPAGVVAALGADVTGHSISDRVVVKPPIACGTCGPCRAGEDDACERISSVGIHRSGGLAEYVAVPARNVFAIPEGLGDAEATAVSHSFPVALTLLRKVDVGPDDTVLVSGASGSIGNATVQVARSLGARVIGAVGSEAGATWLRELPPSIRPDHVIDYAEPGAFAPAVREAAMGGVSVYVETASDPAVWSEALTTLAPRGRIAVIGAHAGPVVELNTNWLFRQRITIFGCSGSSLAAYADALAMVGRGDLVPHIDSVVPLDGVVAAYRRLMQHQNRGKIVLRIADGVDST